MSTRCALLAGIAAYVFLAIHLRAYTAATAALALYLVVAVAFDLRNHHTGGFR